MLLTIISMIIVALIVVADQVSKILVVANIPLRSSVEVIPNIFRFTYIQNDGAAFGMLDDHRWVFMSFSTIAIIGICVYLFAFRPKNRYLQITLAMLAGGGIGNMIDRILLGYVIDFIDVRLIHFAIFNVADSFITVSAFMLMGYLILDTVREFKEEKAKAQKAAESDTTTQETELQDDGTAE